MKVFFEDFLFCYNDLMAKAKLILINGFMASGKTTIAKKYFDDHKMTFLIEADMLVDNISDWTSDKIETRHLTYALTKVMIQTYLRSGHDVVLPYFVTDANEIKSFESIAHKSGADFYEFFLNDVRSVAIDKLLSRGKWGMSSSPAITEKDIPKIEKDFKDMQVAIKSRPDTVKIQLKGASPESTYRQLLEIIEP
jgi:predicted kinase